MSKIVIIYATRETLPDGTIVTRPLRTVEPEDEIGLGEAMKITGLGERRLQFLCETGEIKSARKPGGKPSSRWRVSRSEMASLSERQAV